MWAGGWGRNWRKNSLNTRNTAQLPHIINFQWPKDHMTLHGEDNQGTLKTTILISKQRLLMGFHEHSRVRAGPWAALGISEKMKYAQEETTGRYWTQHCGAFRLSKYLRARRGKAIRAAAVTACVRAARPCSPMGAAAAAWS